ncbi:MAG: tRNA lysidine(34) synthetase TilS [Holosporaceae bacterium]|jgi:tRNA(Ile)-lysidine synthase|nr:tRNA lysidine(34) synthetase TilS [Holosporaceae bacterium]
MSDVFHNKFQNERSALDLFYGEMDRLIEFCRKHYSLNSIDSVCVAVSGGSDSMTLLIMSAEWAKKNDIRVYCATVDHKLREESAEEAKFVGDFCRSISVTHRILEWKRNERDIPHGKLENLAREARYRLISEFCENNGIPILLTAHNWNDQIETFEMRKNAGSRASGLAGMSQVRSLTEKAKLLRPTLYFTKDYLNSFLKKRNVSWKNDPMNEQEKFLRVSYRKKIADYDDDKILSISNEIMRFGKMRNKIETAAVRFLKEFCEFSRESAVIDKEKFLSEAKSVQTEILKRAIWNVGGKEYAPSVREDILDKILRKEINTLGRCLLKIKKEKIFLFRENRTKTSTSSDLPCDRQHHKIGGESSSENKAGLFDVFFCGANNE